MADHRAQSASISAITANISSSWRSDMAATTAPRWPRGSTSPMASSWRIASRIGVRDTPKVAAIDVSSSGAPGDSLPWTMSSAIA